ncbi:MAG: hypothetical protein NZ516_04065 [Raineya sp.]|nr:hypothetical protein [Raineya sp.]
MQLFVAILMFVVFGGLVFFIFYFRLQTIQESRKIVDYFQKVAEKFGLQAQLERKSGNVALPRLEGVWQNRHIIIERTIQEKYNYLVISIELNNLQKIHFQITPKNHLRAKEKADESQLISTQITWIDKDYFVSGSPSDKVKAICEDFFTPFANKYAQIWFLFSTLVIFQNRITLVLLSSLKKLRYDLIIEQMLLDLHHFANQLENEHTTKQT